MLKINLEKRLEIISKQRKAFLVLFLITLATAFMLSVAIMFKDTKVIIVPTGFSETIEVEGGRVSVSYIRQMTNYFLNNLLDLNAYNIEFKKNEMLMHVSQEAEKHVVRYFKLEAKEYKEYKLSTSFVVDDIEIDPKNISARIKGRIYSFYSKQGHKKTDIEIHLKYDYKGQKLKVREFVITKTSLIEKKEDEADGDNSDPNDEY